MPRVDAGGGAEGELGDDLGVVAAALDAAGDGDVGQGEVHVARALERLGARVAGKLVDLPVVGDGLAGEVLVELDEGDAGAVELRGDEAGGAGERLVEPGRALALLQLAEALGGAAGLVAGALELARGLGGGQHAAQVGGHGAQRQDERQDELVDFELAAVDARVFFDDALERALFAGGEAAGEQVVLPLDRCRDGEGALPDLLEALVDCPKRVTANSHR